MPAEWYRGWAPEVPEAAPAAPPADADVAQISIRVRRRARPRLAAARLAAHAPRMPAV